MLSPNVWCLAAGYHIRPLLWGHVGMLLRHLRLLLNHHMAGLRDQMTLLVVHRRGVDGRWVVVLLHWLIHHRVSLWHDVALRGIARVHLPYVVVARCSLHVMGTHILGG